MSISIVLRWLDCATRRSVGAEPVERDDDERADDDEQMQARRDEQKAPLPQHVASPCDFAAASATFARRRDPAPAVEPGRLHASQRTGARRPSSPGRAPSRGATRPRRRGS